VLAGRLHAEFRKPPFRRLLSAEATWKGHRITLVKPLTFMNNSGEVFPWLLRRSRRGRRSHGRTGTGIESVLVICDNLDLPPGVCRLRRRGSPSSGGGAGHKGLDSIVRRTGSREFMRLYIGIGRPGRPGEVVDYVLAPPEEIEAPLIAEAVERAADAVLRLPEDGLEQVMNGLNQQKRG
jgi:PTH1 family peptidyl-tRNA hydrolase